MITNTTCAFLLSITIIQNPMRVLPRMTEGPDLKSPGSLSFSSNNSSLHQRFEIGRN